MPIQAGKGSRIRPSNISRDEWDRNYAEAHKDAKIETCLCGRKLLIVKDKRYCENCGWIRPQKPL